MWWFLSLDYLSFNESNLLVKTWKKCSYMSNDDSYNEKSTKRGLTQRPFYKTYER